MQAHKIRNSQDIVDEAQKDPSPNMKHIKFLTKYRVTVPKIWQVASKFFYWIKISPEMCSYVEIIKFSLTDVEMHTHFLAHLDKHLAAFIYTYTLIDQKHQWLGFAAVSKQYMQWKTPR